ncbi:MAG: UvrD-helicase domain-containing protein [Holosporaceae bacterium]|jgi:DNA helicase-2/ATP-dependent DNA helicase PcrA|nr:UvrD-helicase domain-containing protein [Holosporaceae bacterium]
MNTLAAATWSELKDQILESLNPEQCEAVVTLDKSLLVLSGAGTGKTKVLTTRIAYIIENGYAMPSQILAVTFSNRASREMKKRLLYLTRGETDGIWLGTFHAIGAKILRQHAGLIGIKQNFVIIDTDDQMKIMKRILKEYNIDKKMASGILAKISRWKDRGMSCDNPNLDATVSEKRFYKIYQEHIIGYDSVDFGDLLLYVIEIFRKYPDVLQKYQRKFRYILVDEYQDTNLAQYMWLKLLSPSGDGLCCVGDDDQAIYSWRGAEISNILNFERDFPNTKVIRLERNYRSTGHILGAASSLISNNKNRLGKTIWTNDDPGEKVMVHKVRNGFEEALLVADKIESLHQSGVKYNEMAVLVRAGFQTREFEERFIAYGLPYRVVGGLKFYDRQEVKDVIAYLRLIYQPNDSLAFERIINVPRRGIGTIALAKFHTLANSSNISLYRASQELLGTGELRPSLRTALDGFLELIESMRLQQDLRPVDIAKNVLQRTGYFTMLDQEQSISAQGRRENLRELLIALEDFDDLQTFIEHVGLVSDSPLNSVDDCVCLMTLHCAKGLEFDVVFLVGWEDGVFPHSLSLQEQNVEEERRLAYVGLTRAKKLSFISYAASRRIYNLWQSNPPSRFLCEFCPTHVNFCKSSLEKSTKTT